MKKHIALRAFLILLLTTISNNAFVDAQESGTQTIRDQIVVEAAMRLSDPKSALENDKIRDAILRHVDHLGNSSATLRVLERFPMEGSDQRLLDIAIALGVSNEGVKAIDLALQNKGDSAIKEAVILTEDEGSAAAKDKSQTLTKLLSLSNRGDAKSILKQALETPNVDSSLRIAAATGLARGVEGQKYLIQLAESRKLPADAATMIAATLRGSRDESVAKKAEELFPALSSAGKPLPPIEQLAQRKGNSESGQKLFASVATCGQCHTVRGSGKNVGPDLSEIGDKLTREAMLVAIVNPSAGISHNYEAYSALTSENEVVTGLLVSKNASEVILKDKDGIERKFAMDDIELKKLETSLMPNNLHDLFDQQGLVDIVEYMSTLKKNK